MPPLQPQTALKDLNDKVCVELLMGAVFGIAALVGSPTGGDHSNSGFDAKKFEGPDLVIPTTHPPCFKGLVSEEPVIGGVNSTIPTHQHLSTFRLCLVSFNFYIPSSPVAWVDGLLCFSIQTKSLSHAFHRWPGWNLFCHLTTRQFSRKVSPKRPLIDKRPSFRCSWRLVSISKTVAQPEF